MLSDFTNERIKIPLDLACDLEEVSRQLSVSTSISENISFYLEEIPQASERGKGIMITPPGTEKMTESFWFHSRFQAQTPSFDFQVFWNNP